MTTADSAAAKDWPGVRLHVVTGKGGTGKLLIDGGVCDNTPLSHAIELGAEEIYVLPAGFACGLEAPPRGALDMLLHAMSVMLAQRRCQASGRIVP